MIKQLTVRELESAKSNFADNDPMEVITRSAFISLSELEQFIEEIKAENNNVSGVRVSFIRFKPGEIPAISNEDQHRAGCKFLFVKNDNGNVFTQVSIAIVPVQNFRVDENYFTSADDLVMNDLIKVLMPGIEKKPTGLNPPPSPDKKKVIDSN
jgi:hypothetical protein